MELTTELVHTKGGDIYTTSILVSEKLEVPHNKLLRTIERVIKDYNFHTPPVSTEFKFIETTFTTKMNKTYKSYDMNEEAFIILVMNLSSYDKAKMVQMLFVRAFHNMKQILQQHTNASWIEARETGKIERLAETDTIRDFVDYAEKQGNTKARFYYSTLTKMTYKALELVNCETPIRDILNSVGLQYLAELERQVQYALQDGMNEGLDYKHIYANTKDRIIKYCEFIPKRVVLTLK